MSKAFIFPGRFDPITLGHEHLARRAAGLCERLFVAVATRPEDRAFLLGAERRIGLCAEILAPCANIEIIALDGLLVDCAKRCGATVIVRGIRDSGDFAREQQLADINRDLGDGLETMLLPSLREHRHISASAVRELAGYSSASLDSLVRPAVADSLRELL